MRFVAELDGETVAVEVTEGEGEGRFRVKVDAEVYDVDARRPASGVISLLIGGASYLVDVAQEEGRFRVDVRGESYRIGMEEETRNRLRTLGGDRGGVGGHVLVAPMPGKVVHVAVSEGQSVKAGDGLVVIEAMKMENEFKSAVTGTVKEVRVQAGQAVNPGDVLVVIE